MICDLSGKAALVSGSTSGIGRAIAVGLAQAGAAVAINGRDAARTQDAIQGLSREVPGAEFIAATGDLSDSEAAASVLAAAGDIDILVNNLGMYEPVPALEITEMQWLQMLEINLMSGVRLTQSALGSMQERGWGRVLFIASDAGIAVPADMVHYGVSKASVIAAARGFAKAVRGSGVTVNSVIAGPTLTDGVHDFVRAKLGEEMPWDEAEREFMRTERGNSLLGRFIRAEEIANMVTYLSSPLASATTGGALRVDGGYTDSMLP